MQSFCRAALSYKLKQVYFLLVRLKSIFLNYKIFMNEFQEFQNNILEFLEFIHKCFVIEI